MLSGLHRHARLKTRIGRMHVDLEFGRALRVAGEILGHGRALGFATHREAFDADSVQPDIDLVRLTHAHDVVVELPPEQNFDRVIAVQRKVVMDERAALRSKRQVVAHMIVLHEEAGVSVSIDRRVEREIAHGEAAHFARRRKVILKQHGRHGENAGHVVETFLIRVIGGEQGLPVDIEPSRSRTAAVYSARFKRCTATRPGLGLARAAASSAVSNSVVTFAYVALSGRGRPAGGISPVRSLRATFSHKSACSTDVVDVSGVELQTGGFQFRVMAGDAVFFDDRPGRKFLCFVGAKGSRQKNADGDEQSYEVRPGC